MCVSWRELLLAVYAAASETSSYQISCAHLAASAGHARWLSAGEMAVTAEACGIEGRLSRPCMVALAAAGGIRRRAAAALWRRRFKLCAILESIDNRRREASIGAIIIC